MGRGVKEIEIELSAACFLTGRVLPARLARKALLSSSATASELSAQLKDGMPAKGRVLVIEVIRVSEPLRGRGLGRQMVTEAEKAAVADGAETAFLLASRLDDDQDHPSAFWEANGYEAVTDPDSWGDRFYGKVMK